MDTVELASSLTSFDTENPPGNEEGRVRFLGDKIKDIHIDGSGTEVQRLDVERQLGRQVQR